MSLGYFICKLVLLCYNYVEQIIERWLCYMMLKFVKYFEFKQGVLL